MCFRALRHVCVSSYVTPFPISYTQDPGDPTTFPGYQGGPHLRGILSQAPRSSNIGSRNAPANTGTSLPRAGDITATPLSDLILWIFHRSLGPIELLFIVFPPFESFFF